MESLNILCNMPINHILKLSNTEGQNDGYRTLCFQFERENSFIQIAHHLYMYNYQKLGFMELDTRRWLYIILHIVKENQYI